MKRAPEFNVSPKAAMSVAISVVLRADEVPADSPDLIVFPEGISWDQIHFAAAHHPNTAIVGGVDEGGWIRAALWRARANRIDTARSGRMAERKEAAFCHRSGQSTSLMICASVCCSAWTLTLPYSVAPSWRESGRASAGGSSFRCPQTCTAIGFPETISGQSLQARTLSFVITQRRMKCDVQVSSLTRRERRFTSSKATSRSM